MKRISRYLAVSLLAVGVAGCGGSNEKGAATEDSVTSPEMQKIIDNMNSPQGRQKQFGDRAGQAPERPKD